MSGIEVLQESFASCVGLFLRATRGHRGRLVGGILLASVNMACSLGVPLLAKFIIDFSIVRGFTSYLLPAILGAALLLAVMTVSSLLANRWLIEVSQIGAMKLKADLFRNLQLAPHDFLSRVDPGSIAHRLLTDTEAIVGFWTQASVAAPMGLVLVASGGVMLSFDPMTTALVFVALGLQAAIVVFYKQPILAATFLAKEKGQQLTSFVVEHFSRIDLVRVRSMEEREQGRLNEIQREQLPQRVRLFMLQKSSDVMSTLVQYAWIFAILGYGGVQVTHHRMTLGMLTAFLLLSNILFKPFMTLLGLVLCYQDVRSSLRRIVEYRQERPYVRDVPAAEPRSVIAPNLELRDVGFRYAQTQVLEHVNLAFAPHRITALVGASGAGKTTLCKLLVRIQDPTEGRVILDGRDVREMSLAELRRAVFVSLQGQHVFNGTLWENLTYGADEVTRQEALLALKYAGLELSRHFMAGWETRIGERGINLSVGETQRIAIARAFLSRPRIYVFDEAMAHLDGVGEEIIQRSLQRLKETTTVLLVTHRYSTLLIADDVAILDGGLLVEHRSLEAALGDPSSVIHRFHATPTAEARRMTEISPTSAALDGAA